MNFNPFKKTESPVKAGSSQDNLPWKKYVTLFLTGVISMQSLEAASLSLTPDEKKDAIKYMESSPDKVKAFEAILLKEAESLPAQDDGKTDQGEIKTKKVFNTYENGAAYIEYVNDHPVSINVREGSPSGVETIVSDGYAGQAMDGRMDHVTLVDSKKVKTRLGFKETINEKGEPSVEVTGAKFSEGAASLAYVNFQKSLEDKLQKASADYTAKQLASAALEKGTINSISPEQQAKLDAQAGQNAARFGVADNTQK